MSRYSVRALRSDDFSTVMAMEDELFEICREGVLGPYYVRLCCDFFADCCFMLEDEGRPVGYLLSFVRGREAYCTTLALRPGCQGTRAIIYLLRAFITRIIDDCDVCWFTVDEDSPAVRALHAMLGAEERELRPDFYGPGNARIVSRIDREGFERARPRLERLGVVPRREGAQGVAEVLQ
ncbi:MAG: alanine acetyltransferase [Myxococcales bacterium]|nr:alanine acetyltransferase [Myxococcales bacterium]MCB9748920.1 alanine acetyltransferase [Myxococcales bacterium]